MTQVTEVAEVVGMGRVRVEDLGHSAPLVAVEAEGVKPAATSEPYQTATQQNTQIAYAAIFRVSCASGLLCAPSIGRPARGVNLLNSILVSISLNS